MAMFEWWHVLADDERQQWALDPFVSVGPLRFGMRPGEVSRALSGVTEDSQRHTSHRRAAETVYVVVEGQYRKFGLELYYREERLAGVVVDALRGPQVLADGMALVGRVPSVLEEWAIHRTEEPYSDIGWMAAGVPVSHTLGVVIGAARAGDHLLTQPVFLPSEGIADLPDFLPGRAWRRVC